MTGLELAALSLSPGQLFQGKHLLPVNKHFIALHLQSIASHNHLASLDAGR